MTNKIPFGVFLGPFRELRRARPDLQKAYEDALDGKPKVERAQNSYQAEKQEESNDAPASGKFAFAWP